MIFGEGLPPVPLKLAEKIRRWEFIEMAEPLPEHWGQVPGGKPDDEQGGQRPPSRRKRKVTDIVSWSQWFAIYVRILAGTSPRSVPELLAYMVHMLQVSQDFGGLAWINYDRAFRRQAASTGNRLWSRINPSLYSICLSGVARVSKRCELCFGLTHDMKDCALSGDGDPDVGACLKAIESAVLALISARPSQPAKPQSRPEVCRSWNENRCTFPRCRYQHVCRICGGPKPAVECCKRAMPSSSTPPTGRLAAAKPWDMARPY